MTFLYPPQNHVIYEPELAADLLTCLYESTVMGLAITDEQGFFVQVNPTFCRLYGYTAEELLGQCLTKLLPAETWNYAIQAHQAFLTGRSTTAAEWQEVTRKDGSVFDAHITTERIVRADGQRFKLTTVLDMTQGKREQAKFAQAEQQYRQQRTEREQLLAATARRIRQSLDLEEILQTTVMEVRHLLQVDRVVIWQLQADESLQVVAESVGTGWTAMLHANLGESWLQEHLQAYHQGATWVLNDLHEIEYPAEVQPFIDHNQLRALAGAPILHKQGLWGILAIHQCAGPRVWTEEEVDLLQQIVTQVGIAIQQSDLYQQVQQLNTDLEQQVQAQTLQLRQALTFEATLKSITDKVRDSLDETHIFQAVVEELGEALAVDYCNTALYFAGNNGAAVVYEYSHSTFTLNDLLLPIADFSEVYQQLWQNRCIQMCPMLHDSEQQLTVLLCALFDDQGLLGDLLLVKAADHVFSEAEVRLVQQIANQCAIALRQARLYQAAQSQVRELERLNQLKDDFLSTVSHELRTPVSSVKVASQMLVLVLQQRGVLTQAPTDPVWRYLKVLQEECDREIRLINNLLDLQRLEAEGTLSLEPIDLRIWLPYVLQPFEDQTRQREQRLHLQLPSTLPLLFSNMSRLQRIMTELLTNACKYTPEQEQIIVTAKAEAGWVEICVINSGIEIAPDECDRIFDKFYRIPKADRWKHGGTGLGLSLVKKLVEQLRGNIQVMSHAARTTFTVNLPVLRS